MGAKSEDILFTEVLTKYGSLVDKQEEIRHAIDSLVKKGIIVHDKKNPDLIHLK